MTAVMILAGGTGGHVYPALAVADALREANCEVSWLGTRTGLEARAVPAAGITIDWMRVSGLRGRGLLAWLGAPFRLTRALAEAVAAMRHRRPTVVLGMGGFVAGPGGVAAWLTRRPLVIHEQNAVAGLTNRLLAPLAREVLEGFPNSFPDKVVARHVGNPVRATIAALPTPAHRFAGRTGRPNLLVLGGSQGALALNETVPAAIGNIDPVLRPRVWHQCGAHTHNVAERTYAEYGVEARLTDFIDDMAAAYAWADIVVCRAGALTVAELAAAGVGAVLVPYPASIDDHQTLNARFLEQAGAGLIVPQRELDPARLAARLLPLLDDRERLLAMANAARSLARTDATAAVRDVCLQAATGQADD